MRCSLILFVILSLSGPASTQTGQGTSANPDQFEIGRRTFFDFGPPFDFYEIFIVRPAGGRTSIDRITLTPPGYSCLIPAKLEVSSALIDKSVAELLGGTNPCTIPEKALRSELKRCKHCTIFSGADVAMRVQCGSQTRIIRSDILDRDMFDASAKTPHHTSWTMALLANLDHATGPGVLDRPMLAVSEKMGSTDLDSETRQHLSAGNFDLLFPTGSSKPSELYRAATKAPPPVPSVRLVSSMPFDPEHSRLPAYPPIALAAQVAGSVSFGMGIDSNGVPTDLVFWNGSPLLQAAIRAAVSEWRFAKPAFGQREEVMIDFKLNCPTSAEANVPAPIK